MMDRQEATKSLNGFADQLFNLCKICDFFIASDSEKTDELVETLKGVRKHALRVQEVVLIAIGHEQRTNGSMDGLEKLFEASNRLILALEEADGVLDRPLQNQINPSS